MPPPAPDRVSILNILAELTYPEYRDRHIFTARLRILIVFAFMFFYVLAYRQVIPITHPALLCFAGACLVTLFCYYNILVGQWMLFALLLELAADMVALTVIVYLLGGIASFSFLLYACYVLMAGLFYNHRIAAGVSVLAVVSYGALFALSTADLSSALLIHVTHHELGWTYPIWLHLVLLVLFLTFGMYALKTAQNFGLLRERSLEARNRELLTLQGISGMIRTSSTLREVTDRVLHGLMEGLDLAGCWFMLADHQRRRFSCYPPSAWALGAQAEQTFGIPLQDLSLSFDTVDNHVFRQIQQRHIAFRNDLSAVLIDMQPSLDPAVVQAFQRRAQLQQIIVVPLVAEEELLGAFVCLSTDAIVGERAVSTLELFADQAALVLRVTLLIDALKTSNRELVEANRVKSEFLATMSHELRTPLTAIIGFSELLVEGAMGPMSEEQLDSLREILNNGSNLLELINNILDLARMESGRMTLSLAPFDLRDLLERTQRAVSSLLARKHQHFHLELPLAMPPMVGDEKRMQQVILNLLGNAIKFTPDGGTIGIRAQHLPHGDAVLAFATDRLPPIPTAMTHGGFCIQVSDTGIGIPPEHLESIFEMFKQIDSSVTRTYEGTGLGLALVKQLVEMHGGLIWAESRPGHGTTFSCLFPIEPTTVPPP